MTVKPLVLPRPTIVVLLGAVLALTLSACGGATSHTTANAAATAPSGPSKAQFVARANAVCEATNGPLTATALKLETQRSPAAAAKIVAGTFIPEIEAQARKIEALGTPVGGQATIATMDRLLAGDVARIAKHPQLAGAAAFHDFATVAHGYGLTACAPLS
ncbi:MAG TPA: hypothetical protein VMB91_02700 [Solirubrobacteraceae bacterium]|nr:hypothetical protein [Solirubrobacteraceae bacterium]